MLGTNWKMNASALLMILTGAAQMAGIAPDIMAHTVPGGWDLVMMGFATFGAAHKFERIAASAEAASKPVNVVSMTPPT